MTRGAKTSVRPSQQLGQDKSMCALHPISPPLSSPFLLVIPPPPPHATTDNISQKRESKERGDAHSIKDAHWRQGRPSHATTTAAQDQQPSLEQQQRRSRISSEKLDNAHLPYHLVLQLCGEKEWADCPCPCKAFMQRADQS